MQQRPREAAADRRVRRLGALLVQERQLAGDERAGLGGSTFAPVADWLRNE
ncbi:hypothetical protein [Streptomyces sp900116325]|uniref:hypothetical protein n=1 Tax=Streptomyces sp. 900116325 TaxID=3154295 RepID=UPI0033A6EA95